MRIAWLVVIVGALLLVGGLALVGSPGTLGSVGVGLAMAGIAGLGVFLVYSDVTAARTAGRGAGGGSASAGSGSETTAEQLPPKDREG